LIEVGIHRACLRELERVKVGHMAGKFEIYTDQQDEYRFRLKARNGESSFADDCRWCQVGREAHTPMP
jgi:hypothetical protein